MYRPRWKKKLVSRDDFQWKIDLFDIEYGLVHDWRLTANSWRSFWALYRNNFQLVNQFLCSNQRRVPSRFVNLDYSSDILRFCQPWKLIMYLFHLERTFLHLWRNTCCWQIVKKKTNNFPNFWKVNRFIRFVFSVFFSTNSKFQNHLKKITALGCKLLST